MKLVVGPLLLSLAASLNSIDSSEQGNPNPPQRQGSRQGSSSRQTTQPQLKHLQPARQITRAPYDSEMGEHGFRDLSEYELLVQMGEGPFAGHVTPLQNGDTTHWMKDKDFNLHSTYSAYIEMEKEANNDECSVFYLAESLEFTRKNVEFDFYYPGTVGPVHAILRLENDRKHRYFAAGHFKIYEHTKYHSRESADRQPVNFIFILKRGGPIFFAPLNRIDVEFSLSKEKSSEV